MPFSISQNIKNLQYLDNAQVILITNISKITRKLLQSFYTKLLTLVEMSGFEPLAFRLQSGRSTN